MKFLHDFKRCVALFALSSTVISYAMEDKLELRQNFQAEFATVESHGQKAFLACTKRYESKCEEYQFFIQKKNGATQKIHDKFSVKSLLKLRNQIERKERTLERIIEEPSALIYLVPTSFFQTLFFSLKGLKPLGMGLMVVSIPVDLAILPLTSIALGIAHIDRAIKKSQIKPAYEAIIGLNHKKNIKLPKKSFELLSKVISSLSFGLKLNLG